MYLSTKYLQDTLSCKCFEIASSTSRVSRLVQDWFKSQDWVKSSRESNGWSGGGK